MIFTSNLSHPHPPTPPTLQESALRVFDLYKYLAAEDEHLGFVTGDKLFWIRKHLLASEEGVVSYISYSSPHTFALSESAIRECHSAWTTSGTGRLAARITDSRGSQPGTSQFRSMGNINRCVFCWKLPSTLFKNSALASLHIRYHNQVANVVKIFSTLCIVWKKPTSIHSPS